MKDLRVLFLASCVLSISVIVGSTIVLANPDNYRVRGLTPQEYDTDSVKIHQFMIERKEQAEIEWKREQDAAIEQRATKAIEREISINKKRKREQKALETARRKSVEAAKKKLRLAKKEAAKFESIAAKKVAKARKTVKKKRSLGHGTSYSIGSEGRSSWKSWMSYKAIKTVSSPQWKLQHTKAYTGKHGIRMVDGRYCVAVGSHYCSTIGTKLDVVLQNGSVIKCILAEQKADHDTDSLNRYHVSDGSYLEFVVDDGALDYAARRDGTCGSISEFSGKITKIIVYN